MDFHTYMHFMLFWPILLPQLSSVPTLLWMVHLDSFALSIELSQVTFIFVCSSVNMLWTFLGAG